MKKLLCAVVLGFLVLTPLSFAAKDQVVPSAPSPLVSYQPLWPGSSSLSCVYARTNTITGNVQYVTRTVHAPFMGVAVCPASI